MMMAWPVYLRTLLDIRGAGAQFFKQALKASSIFTPLCMPWPPVDCTYTGSLLQWYLTRTSSNLWPCSIHDDDQALLKAWHFFLWQEQWFSLWAMELNGYTCLRFSPLDSFRVAAFMSNRACFGLCFLPLCFFPQCLTVFVNLRLQHMHILLLHRWWWHGLFLTDNPRHQRCKQCFS